MDVPVDGTSGLGTTLNTSHRFSKANIHTLLNNQLAALPNPQVVLSPLLLTQEFPKDLLLSIRLVSSRVFSLLLSPPDLQHSSCIEVVSSLDLLAVHRLTTPLPPSVGVPSPVWITGLSETLGAQAGEIKVTLSSLL
jgi:hypothetical protein